MKKANILIIGMILVIVIFLLFSKSCKDLEGYSEDGSRDISSISTNSTFGNVTGLTTLTSLITELTTSSSTSLSKSNVLAASATANYCAFIDDSSSALKIAKKDTTTPVSWKVIWSSELSNPAWIGETVSFTSATSGTPPGTPGTPAKIQIGSNTIGEETTTTGTKAKLTAEGDLVITKTVSSVAKGNTDVIVWSLVAQELQQCKEQLDRYLSRGSRNYQSTELDTLKKKLFNFSKYIKAVAPTDSSPIEDLKKAHAMIVQARRQMDFDLSELNGVENSKVILSQNGFNSSLYANLMATTLAASLFILIVTR